jgi:hypothetical protein
VAQVPPKKIKIKINKRGILQRLQHELPKGAGSTLLMPNSALRSLISCSLTPSSAFTLRPLKNTYTDTRTHTQTRTERERDTVPTTHRHTHKRRITTTNIVSTWQKRREQILCKENTFYVLHPCCAYTPQTGRQREGRLTREGLPPYAI